MFNKEKKPDEIKSFVKVSERKPKTLYEKIDEIDRKLEVIGTKTRSKKRPYKLKGKIRASLKGLAKKNKLLVWVLESNGNMHGEVVKVNEGWININGLPRRFSPEYRYLYEGKFPCIILPEWNLEPIGLKEYYDQNPTGLDQATGEKLVLAVAQSNEVKQGMKLSGKAWVFIIIGIIAAIYILAGGTTSGG